MKREWQQQCAMQSQWSVFLEALISMYHSMNEKCSSFWILAVFSCLIALYIIIFNPIRSGPCIVNGGIVCVVGLVLWIDRLSVQQQQQQQQQLSPFTRLNCMHIYIYIRIPHLWFYGCALFIRRGRSFSRPFYLSISSHVHCETM